MTDHDALVSKALRELSYTGFAGLSEQQWQGIVAVVIDAVADEIRNDVWDRAYRAGQRATSTSDVAKAMYEQGYQKGLETGYLRGAHDTREMMGKLR